MRPSKIILPFLLITLTSFLMPATPSTAQTNSRRGAPGASAGTVIFSVAKDAEGTVRMEPIDVIDLDRDGTAEVIAEGFEIENNFYVIYKRQATAWRPVYKGGGAC